MDAIEQLETLNMFLSMCTESCDPERFEQAEDIVEHLKKVRGSMRHYFTPTNDHCNSSCKYCGELATHYLHK
jgi:sulfatase maturation enzyme AslB (radical SAM superfamily)